MGPFTIGQVPATPEIFSVAEEDGSLRDLTIYDSFVLHFIRPDGNSVPSDQVGTFRAVDPADPTKVVLDWNPESSPFGIVGTYRYQLEMKTAAGASDLTGISYFNVADTVEDETPNADAWATVADVANVTGQTVTDEELMAAEMVIELVTNRTPASSAAMRWRDLQWLKRAVSFQAVWQRAQPDFYTRMSIKGLSQDGASAMFTSKAAVYLAPLAIRALRNCTWMRSRSLEIGTALESQTSVPGNLRDDSAETWLRLHL